MGVNAELEQNQYTDAMECPAIRRKASVLRSLREQRQHLLPLVNAQTGRTAKNGVVVQTAYIALVPLERLGPFAKGHSAPAHLASDVP
jgi:hypothetical protein